MSAQKQDQNYYQKTFQTCHHTPTLIEVVDGISLYGANYLGVSRRALKDTLSVDLTGFAARITTTFIMHVPKGFELLKKRQATPKVCIFLDWKDGTAPDVKDSFWTTLHELAIKQKFKRLVAYCVGGHGRTGTFLAAYLIANQGYNATTAIATVREQLCDSCIETSEQEEYLYLLAKEEILVPVKLGLTKRKRGADITWKDRIRRYNTKK